MKIERNRWEIFEGLRRFTRENDLDVLEILKDGEVIYTLKGGIWRGKIDYEDVFKGVVGEEEIIKISEDDKERKILAELSAGYHRTNINEIKDSGALKGRMHYTPSRKHSITKYYDEEILEYNRERARERAALEDYMARRAEERAMRVGIEAEMDYWDNFS